MFPCRTLALTSAMTLLIALTPLSASSSSSTSSDATRAVSDQSTRPALLNDAFNTLLEHQGRWAYTETFRGSRDGKPQAETIIRVDPSAPYAEQSVPLQINGQPPTEKQLREAAERAEQAAQQRLDRQQAAAAAATPLAAGETVVRPANDVTIGGNGQEVIPQLDRATVVEEDPSSVTYHIPLEPVARGKGGKLFEKFELTARVNKHTRQFERATIRQRASMRVKLVAKVSETLLVFEFTTPDPDHPAVLTKATFDTRFALFFGKGRALHGESVRTDLRYVTPYDERFGVRLGTLRTLEL